MGKIKLKEMPCRRLFGGCGGRSSLAAASKSTASGSRQLGSVGKGKADSGDGRGRRARLQPACWPQQRPGSCLELERLGRRSTATATAGSCAQPSISFEKAYSFQHNSFFLLLQSMTRIRQRRLLWAIPFKAILQKNSLFVKDDYFLQMLSCNYRGVEGRHHPQRG